MKEVINEGIKDTIKYLQPPNLTKEACQDAINFILKKIDQNLETFTYKYPAPASKNNIYPAVDNVEWTSSFWTGMLWLAFEITGDKKYQKVAEIQLDSYKKRVDERIKTGTHDLGFLYTLSCVASFKLTKNEEAKDIAIKAADLLMERYFEKAGIIQAWGSTDDPVNGGRMIIDCCMNLPLLFWASEVTGDKKYFNAAYNHVKQAEKYIIREDSSSYHTYFMDIYTGEPKYGETVQGYSDDSCWARGQAWGIYGFPLSYNYTADYSLIELSKKVANYFLNRLPEDYIAYWDLIFTNGTEERDSSSAAIAACGLMELSKKLPLTDSDKKVYENAALHIVKSLSENYTSVDVPESNGVLLHAVYAKPHNRGVDECNIWGDYYYFEALVRLLKDWKAYWQTKFMGYHNGRFAPGIRDFSTALKVCHNILLSHGKAVRTYREMKLAGSIGITLDYFPAKPASESEKNKKIQELDEQQMNETAKKLGDEALELKLAIERFKI